MKGGNMSEKCACNGKHAKELAAVIEKYKDTEGSLIQVLHEAQDIYGYLPFEVQKFISEKMNISLAEVYGVVSFYTQFTVNPKGDNQINVCMGTACYVKGSSEILDKFRTRLSLDVDECTDDRKFSLHACRCLGACGLAPVVTINEDVYGKLTPDKVDEIIDKYEGKVG